jgi:hypothetical protein
MASARALNDSTTSENQLQRQLNVPWATAAHEWVADADVGVAVSTSTMAICFVQDVYCM